MKRLLIPILILILIFNSYCIALDSLQQYNRHIRDKKTGDVVILVCDAKVMVFEGMNYGAECGFGADYYVLNTFMPQSGKSNRVSDNISGIFYIAKTGESVYILELIGYGYGVVRPVWKLSRYMIDSDCITPLIVFETEQEYAYICDILATENRVLVLTDSFIWSIDLTDYSVKIEYESSIEITNTPGFNRTSVYNNEWIISKSDDGLYAIDICTFTEREIVGDYVWAYSDDPNSYYCYFVIDDSLIYYSEDRHCMIKHNLLNATQENFESDQLCVHQINNHKGLVLKDYSCYVVEINQDGSLYYIDCLSADDTWVIIDGIVYSVKEIQID